VCRLYLRVYEGKVNIKSFKPSYTGWPRVPLFSSGILLYKHLFDRVYRHLIIEGLDVETAKSAVNSLRDILKSKVEELKIRDEDVVCVEIEYEIADSVVSWKSGTLKLTLYKPIEELKEIIKERDRLLAENRELKEKINSIKERLKGVIDSISRMLEEI